MKYLNNSANSDLREAYSFSDEQMSVIDDCDPAKLTPLRKLLKPLDKGASCWSKLKEIGFNKNDIMEIFSSKDSNKRLGVLRTFIKNSTSLSTLQKTGFKAKHFMDILMDRSFKKHFESLKKLGEKGSKLEDLLKVGLSVDQVACILATGNGLVILNDLLTEIKLDDGTSVTVLEAVQQIGFTIDHIVEITNVFGGSKNFAAMRALAKENKEGLSILKKTGFALDQIVTILSKIGGSRNLKAVIELLKEEAVRDFIKNYENGLSIIMMLLSKDSMARRIECLKSILDKEEYRARIKEASALMPLCKKLGNRELKILPVIKSLEDLCKFVRLDVVDHKNEKTKKRKPLDNDSELLNKKGIFANKGDMAVVPDCNYMMLR